MTVVKTKVTNDTNATIELKQGSAGIYVKLGVLTPKSDTSTSPPFTIKLESNTTYREYWCAVQPGSDTDPRVIFSSDDCAEYKEVKVIEKPEGSKQYTWVGTVKRSGEVVGAPDNPGAVTSRSASPAQLKWFHNFRGLFKGKTQS